MTAQRSRWFATMIGLVVGTTLATPILQAAEPVTAPLPAQSPALASDFATVVGDPVDIVSQRLLADPGMVPLAIEAIDARTHRLQRGRKMASLGYSGAGVGIALAILGAVAWSADNSVCTPEDQSGCNFQGLLYFDLIVLGGAMTVAGLVIGGIGSHKLNTPSELEEIACNRYHHLGCPRAPVVSPREPNSEYSFARQRNSSVKASGKVLCIPLLSISF